MGATTPATREPSRRRMIARRESEGESEGGTFRGNMLDAYFKISELDSSVRQEVIAGVTTFLTMA